MVRTTHSIEFKSRVIHIYLTASPKVSLGHMERVTKVKRQVISGWLKNKDAIQAQQGKRVRTRLPNKNPKCLCPAMELKLKDWIITNRNLGACIDGTLIKSKAKEFYLEINPVPDETDQPEEPAYITFSASCTWLNLFCSRNNFSLRRITTTGRDLPHDSLDRLNKFFHKISDEFQKYSYPEAAVLNMDESALYLDAPCK